MYEITPEEIRSFQDAHDISDAGLVILTGLKSDKGVPGAAKTVRMWKHSKPEKRARPPGAAVMIIRACAANPELIDTFMTLGRLEWRKQKVGL